MTSDKGQAGDEVAPEFRRLTPLFSQAAVSSLIASIVRGVLEFGEEMHDRADQPTLPTHEYLTLLSQALERDLAHWDEHVLQNAPPRLKNELRVIRVLLQETLKHQMSFGPSHDQPN